MWNHFHFHHLAEFLFDDPLEGRPAVYWTETNRPISKNKRLISPNPVPWETWQVFLPLVLRGI
jgi:hypothetical protein